ncbi:MAG TPA: hypothetical protein PKV70_07920, partial [Thermodesulfobacteriota bacterium]|nr:hypothetical protein [Thermodesulfobacteriota bacterium]
MRRVAVFLLALTFLVPSAHGWDLTKKVAAPWWIHGLTFYAPFDDPASPLKLLRGAGALTFTRAHDATHTATYVHPGTGLVTVADNNQLRIEAGGALVEGARTNKALYSEALGLASTWIPVSMTVDNNSVVAPNGNTTAETLTATGDNAVLYQAIAGTHLDYVYSAYLKRKTGTGTVSVSADNATWTTCTIDNASWTRCSDIRHYPDTSVQNPGIRIATSGDAVYAWGTQ